MIRHRVSDRAVGAAVAVHVRVEVIAPLERAVGVVDPLVEVAHHVVDTVGVRASVALTASCECALDLIEP